ncbi:MAG: tetratricopeptide repeat protein [Bacteroidia bacterium]|nr:tetratricopeptide repeat protein [Bacteroidia bacterium]
MKGIRHLYLFVLLLLSQQAGAGNFKTPADSFRSMLRVAKHDTDKVVAMLRLGWELHHNDIDTALILSTNALRLAKETGLELYIASAENNQGLFNYYKGNYQAAIDYLSRSLKRNSALGRHKQIANNFLNLGLVYERMGSQSLALDHYLKALKIREDLKDSVGIAWCYNNVGAIHFNMRNYDLSLRDYHKSLKVFERIWYDDGIGWVNNNIGSVYLIKGMPDSAIPFFEKGLEIYRALGRKSTIAECYSFLGDAYLLKREFGKAEEYLRSALDLALEVGADATVSSAYSLYARYHRLKRDFQLALESSRKALVMAKNIGSVELIRSGYEDLSGIFSDMGRPDSAYYYSQKYIQLQDSIFSERALRQINEMSALYDTEKKQQEIEMLHMESGRQALVNAALGVGAFLMLMVIILGIRSFRQKNKSNKQLQEQNMIIAEKNKNITDSITYSKRIQESILPLEEEMARLFPSYFVLNLPKDIVSGDFYWIAEKDEKKIVCVADCTGHGVPGALMSMLGNNLLNQIVMERGVTYPSDILQYLDMGITSALKQTDAGLSQYDGIDCSLVVAERGGDKVLFAGAVRPLIVFREGKMEEYRSGKVSLGGKPGLLKQFPTLSIDLKGVTELFMFSDGYADQFGGDAKTGKAGKKMMVKNFKLLLERIHTMSLTEQKNELLHFLHTWKREYEQVDDILVIGLKP